MEQFGEYCIAILRLPASRRRTPSNCALQLEYLLNVTRQARKNAGLDGVNQTLRIAIGRNEIIPAASRDVFRVQLQNAVGERIPLVMIEKQPAV